MHKKHFNIKFIIFLGVIIFVIFFVFFRDKPTIFIFTNEDTEEPLTGEIFFDNYSFGYLKNGEISVPTLKDVPSTIKLLSEEDGEKFEVEYDFPEDYEDYSSIPFILTKEDINFAQEYYPYKQKDSFSNVYEPHFMKVPITWKIKDISRCWKTEEDKIRKAFSVIQDSSGGYLIFQETYSNPDISVLCDNYLIDEEGFEILGEGGVNESIGNIILKGEANFYGGEKMIVSCTSGFPLTEVHEILHVFGFDHITEGESREYVTDILYLYKDCEYQTGINEHYSSCLKYIYSNGEFKGDCSRVDFL